MRLFPTRFPAKINACLPEFALVALMLALFAPAVSAQSAPSVQALDETSLPAGIRVVVEGHNLPVNSFGLLVQERGTSQPMLAVNADKAFNPASTMKVITTVAALELLGPTYSWSTKVYALGPVVNGTLQGDLLVYGTGDPFLVEEDFRAMLKTLQRRGITRIEGDLILDGSFFDPGVTMQGILDNQASRAYNVLPSAILSNFQAVTFYFSRQPNTRQVRITADPALPNLNIDNRLTLRDASCGGFQRGISFAEDPDLPGGVIFSGQFPTGCGEYQMIRAVLNPDTYTFGLFVLLWQQLGGEFTGTLKSGTLPEGITPLFIWYSRPLTSIIESINKASNNVMTRHLLLTVGAQKLGQPATVEKGIQVITEFLSQQGISTESLVIDNGAGLSREARISPQTMGQMLDFALTRPLAPEFLSSLPLAGLDGTMRNRIRGRNRTVGGVRIKTGSLEGVAAIAGYVQGRSGKVYVVSGMVNHELADEGPGNELLDALLVWALSQ